MTAPPGCSCQSRLRPAWNQIVPGSCCLSGNKRDCPQHQVRHLRPCSFLAALTSVTRPPKILNQQTLLCGGQCPPKSNLHPRLHLRKSRGVPGLPDPLVFSYPLPPGSLLSTPGPGQLCSHAPTLILPPRPTTDPTLHRVSGALPGAAALGARVPLSLPGRVLWETHLPTEFASSGGKGLDSQKAASRDG